MVTLNESNIVAAGNAAKSAEAVSPITNVAVVMPIPNDPDWSIFKELSEDVPIIVCDDSDGKLAPPPRKNVRYFDYAAQRDIMGRHYDAIPHKSAAARNFGHFLAYTEGFDVVVALDYDCRTRDGWLAQHVGALVRVQNAPAIQGSWINSIEQPGFYARGYPYEYRNAEASAVSEASVTGEVKLNMGVWDGVLDLNGIDKIQKEPPGEPGLRGARNYVALGNIPVCGMNTSFRSELTPAYFFLPDIWIQGWQLSRHDDIWGGYILKKLMDKRGDLFSFGRPVVEHTRQTNLNRVVVLEQYMHLMARDFYAIVDLAVDVVPAGSYARMFADFTAAYRRTVEHSQAPAHYRQAFRELGQAMQRWSDAFTQ
jgi:Reversibly glycosylated polypeptide